MVDLRGRRDGPGQRSGWGLAGPVGTCPVCLRVLTVPDQVPVFVCLLGTVQTGTRFSSETQSPHAHCFS